MKNLRFFLLLFANYYYYFLLGCVIAVRGFLLPQIKDDFNINYTISGLMILITAIPGFIMSLFSGFIFSKFNKKMLLIFSSTVVFVFFLLIPSSNSYILFLIFNLFMGLGSFLLVTGVNISIIDIFDTIKPKYKDNVILLLHFLYSLGASLILLVSGTLLMHNLGWRNIYFILGIAFAITPFILIFSKYPLVKDHREEGNRINSKSFFSLILNKKIIFYAICIFFYGGLELCLITWTPTFLERGFNLSKTYSLMTLFVFFLLFCVGRLIGSLIIHKINKVKFLFIAIGLSMICLIASLIFRIRLLNIDIFISMTGLFFSVIFPTIQNMMTSDFKKDLSAATGIFLTANSMGSSVLPFIIGVLNDFLSLKYGIITICAFYIFIIPFLILAIKKT